MYTLSFLKLAWFGAITVKILRKDCIYWDFQGSLYN